ncbi:MAG: hypothetical protein LAN84_06950 [Acidobacteriia bacterium]|nr:hypothetical protein [Terriglobia bacterium]
MSETLPAAAEKPRASLWTWIFRVLRWSTYAAALVTLALALHKSAPPPIQASPLAAERAEQKIRQLDETLASGTPATLRLDESELNSFLATHLDLAPNATPASPPAAEPTEAQVRSSVRDVKVQLIADRLRAYVVFDVHGKEMTLQIEGRLQNVNGYLQFVPTEGAIGSLPIPQSALESAMRRVMESPDNREKLKLPASLADIRVENGEIVVSYK